MTRKGRRLGVAVATAALTGAGALAAAPAHAGTVGVVGNGGLLSFTAAPLETNSVTVVPAANGSIVVRDALNVTTATGPGCANADPLTVVCDADLAVGGVGVILGDNVDAAVVNLPDPTIVFVDGGLGDDLISTGPSTDTVDGGGGNDRISTGPGEDTINGDGFDPAGNGNSVPVGNDAIDGGADDDTAFYVSAPSAVRVDLEDEEARGGGGEDDLSDIENVEGSKFNDDIRGDRTGNRLIGNEGDDRIVARRGEDAIIVEDDDTVSAGAGGDVILGTENGEPTEGDFRCGSGGRDVVSPTPATPKPSRPRYEVDRRCERIEIRPLGSTDPDGLVDPRLKRRGGGRVFVRFHRLERESDARSIRVRLRSDDSERRTLGTARVRIPRGSGTVSRTAKVELNARGRRLLKPGRTRDVILELSSEGFAPVVVTVR